MPLLRSISFCVPLVASVLIGRSDAAAQSCLTITSINVSPPNPTTATPVTITVHGQHANQFCFVMMTSSYANGHTFNITLDCENPEPDPPFILPNGYMEDFWGYTFPAGNWTIDVSGSGLTDNAPANQHFFTVSGITGMEAVAGTPAILGWHVETDGSIVLIHDSHITLSDVRICTVQGSLIPVRVEAGDGRTRILLPTAVTGPLFVHAMTGTGPLQLRVIR